MASRTQLRLSQVTGSFAVQGDGKSIITSEPKSTVAALALTDLSGSLSVIASALGRIHGKSAGEAFNNDEGVFYARVQVDDTTNATSTTDGSLQTDGGLSVALDAVIGDDLFLKSDAAVLNFGADDDVKLTHVHNTGLLLNGASQLQLRDSAIFLNSSGDGVLDIEADTTINIGNDNSGVAISIGHTTSEVTVNDNLTVTGDLTVNGATTTLDTTNLLVEDVVIGLASGASGQNQNGGIAIFSGSSDSDLVLGRIANDLWGFGKKATLKGTVTTLADMDLVSARAATYEVGGATNSISINSTNLTLTAAADVVIDADGADIFFDDDGTRFGGINMNAGSNYLILSSSAGNNVALSSQGGQVFIGDKAFSGLTIAADTANELQFIDRDDRLRINLESAGGNDRILMSGSIRLDHGHLPAQVIFEEASGDGTNTVTLDVGNVTTSYTLTLPVANGNSGEVLKLSDANGNLEFVPSTGDLSKGVKIISSTVSAGTAVNFNAVDAGETISGLTAAGTQGKSLDVFVNGQLLVSGSEAERAAGSRDYVIESATELKFAFNLEADDIVQAIKR